MFGLLALGIGFLIFGFYNLREYFLFKNGFFIKGKVIDVKYERNGVKMRDDFAVITYSYKINGNNYQKTDKSTKKKHLFKMHSMVNEPIQIIVQKESTEKAIIEYKGFLKLSIFLLILGILSILIGIVSKI